MGTSTHSGRWYIVKSMPGTLNIFRLDPKHEPFDKLEPQYQANYRTAGNTYARAYTEAKLKEFLRYTLDLGDDAVMQVVRTLHETGRSTISDVEIGSEDIGALGLVQLAADS